MTDYPDWTVPQASANAVATTGVPLITLPNTLVNASYVINPGATSGPAFVTSNQPSYEVYLNAYESGSGSAGPLQITMQWSDVTGFIVVAEEIWYVWPGVTNGAHYVNGKGPAKGGQLIVKLANMSSAMQYTVNLAVYARSHLYTRDDWRSTFYGTTSAPNAVAASDPPAGFLGNGSASIAAAGTQTYELPLYSGPAYLYFDTSSATTDCQLQLTNSADVNVESAGTRLQRYQSGTLGTFAQQIWLPRFQTRVTLTNNNAAAKTCYFSLYTVEQSV
jgi:hypothetical protein